MDKPARDALRQRLADPLGTGQPAEVAYMPASEVLALLDAADRAERHETDLLFVRDSLAMMMPTLRRQVPALVPEAHNALRTAEEALGVYEGPDVMPETEADRLRKVLREAEWGGIDDNGPPACPVCGEAKRRGHASDCALAAALKGPA